MKTRKQMKEEEERAVAEMEKNGVFKRNLCEWVKNDYNSMIKEESTRMENCEPPGTPHEFI